jgi:hypothetical protein
VKAVGTSKRAMDIVLVANVGQRDLQRDGKPLDKTRLRDEGERILDAYSQEKGRLSAPMIEPAVRHVLQRHGERIREVVLVATDQADERFRAGDTVTCAEVLRKFLKERFGKEIDRDPVVLKVKESPNAYDHMLDLYRKHVVTNKHAQADEVYLLCSGGTPACNMALILAGIERFTTRCHVLNVNQGDGTVVLSRIGRQTLEAYRRNVLAELLERRDFDGAAAMEGASRGAIDLARAAACRLNLDFTESWRILGDLKERLDAWSPVLEGLYAEADVLRDETRPDQAGAVLREVYWNAGTKWRRNECADFLGRVWRLVEAALQNAVAKRSGLGLDAFAYGNAFGKWAEDQPELMAYLTNKALSPRPTTEGLKATIEYFASQGGPDAEALQRLLEVVEWLWRAAKLRNRSVIAHGFRALSKKGLYAAWGLAEEDEGQVMEWLSRLLAVQGFKPGPDPYERYAEAIRALDAGTSYV